jgi:diaminopimelate epimerase
LIPFAKAHACGNHFLIVTEEAADGRNRAELTQRLCARNTGIGVDAMEFFRWTGPAALIARGEAREA